MLYQGVKVVFSTELYREMPFPSKVMARQLRIHGSISGDSMERGLVEYTPANEK